MKKFGVLFLVLLLTLGLTLSACGSKQAEQTNSNQNQEQKQEQKQKIVVASDTSYAPFEFQDPSTGKYVGFDMDLIQAIGEAVGLEVEIKSMNFDGVLTSVQSGTVDAAISAISITDKRKEVMNFSEPYYDSGLAIVVKADNNTIKSIDDLKGKRVAVQIATTGADYANELKAKGIVKEVKTFNTLPDALMELRNNGVDAVINDWPVNAYYIKQSFSDLKMVGDKLSGESYGIAVPKSKPEILAKINEGLKKVKESGKYAEIYEMWFGEKPKN